jgi:hypothetical protein
MNVRLYIDIESGEIRRDLGAAALTGLVFYQGNRVPLEIVFMSGDTEVTSDILTGGATLQVGILSARSGGDVLALTDSYTLVGEVASATLALATAEMEAEFATVPTEWREIESWFEVAVTSGDETTRQTFAQIASRIRRNTIGDAEAPEEIPSLYLLRSSLFDASNLAIAQQFLGIRAEVTSAVLHRAVVTAGRSVPWLIVTLEGGFLMLWVLRARGIGEDDDTNNFRLPDDYNAVSNDVVWMRTTLA